MQVKKKNVSAEGLCPSELAADDDVYNREQGTH